MEAAVTVVEEAEEAEAAEAEQPSIRCWTLNLMSGSGWFLSIGGWK